MPSSMKTLSQHPEHRLLGIVGILALCVSLIGWLIAALAAGFGSSDFEVFGVICGMGSPLALLACLYFFLRVRSRMSLLWLLANTISMALFLAVLFVCVYSAGGPLHRTLETLGLPTSSGTMGPVKLDG